MSNSQEPQNLAALSGGALFLQALESSRKEPDGDLRWDYVRELHRRPTCEVFQAARDLTASSTSVKRILGIDILAQLGYPDLPFKAVSKPIMSTLLEDRDSNVIASAIFAFGHLGLGTYLPKLAAFVGHPSEEVRYALAFAFGGEESNLAIQTLLELSSDTDDDVRNWATFGLGTLSELDQPEIREALLARVDDPHDETRGEALLGLAIRKDGRVTDPLLNELSSDCVGSLAIEAAKELGEPRLLPTLEELTTWWDVDVDLLAKAVKACGS